MKKLEGKETLLSTIQIIKCLQKAMTMAMILGAPILLSAIVVGLTISIIQSVTQIQEQTLIFSRRKESPEGRMRTHGQTEGLGQGRQRPVR